MESIKCVLQNDVHTGLHGACTANQRTGPLENQHPNCIQPPPKDMVTAPPLHQPTASTMYDPADTNLEYVFKQWKDERVEEMGGTGASD